MTGPGPPLLPGVRRAPGTPPPPVHPAGRVLLLGWAPVAGSGGSLRIRPPLLAPPPARPRPRLPDGLCAAARMGTGGRLRRIHGNRPPALRHPPGQPRPTAPPARGRHGVPALHGSRSTGQRRGHRLVRPRAAPREEPGHGILTPDTARGGRTGPAAPSSNVACR